MTGASCSRSGRAPASQTGRVIPSNADSTLIGATVAVSIDGREVRVPMGTTILKAAEQAGIRIPTLCAHPDLCVAGVCRVCVVAVEGMRTLQAACAYPIHQPLKVLTHTREVRQARRHIIDLLVSRHRGECYACARNGNCELQALAEEHGVDFLRFGNAEQSACPVDSSSPAIVRDMNKCVLCRRCVRACVDLQEVGCLDAVGRGSQTKIATFLDKPLAEVVCINCGQCVIRCPTGALQVNDPTDAVWAAIDEPKKSDFDEPFGTATGSGVIFGATGGVMEAALRTVLELVTGAKVEQFFEHADIVPVRGMQGVRKAEVTLPKVGPVPEILKALVPSWDWLEGMTLKVAVAHGTANARQVMEDIRAGGELASFHFIELMACTGGCLGGGGQPIPTSPEIREARARAIYAEDKACTVRKSHENPALLKLYQDFLTDGPCGHRSHELLHTTYMPRGKFIT